MSAALIAILLVSGRAHGQSDEEIVPAETPVAPIAPEEVAPPIDVVEQARVLFLEGTRAMDQGRFELAIEHLEASLAAAARPATAFDLAIALRGAGHPTRAVEILRALLAGTYGELRDGQRADAERLRDATSLDVATVRVRITAGVLAEPLADGSAPGARAEASGPASRLIPTGDELELRIDGLRVDDVLAGAWHEHALDPGRHAITATAHARVPAERVVVLERGASAEIDLELAPEVRPGTLAVAGTEPDLQVEIVGIARGRGQVTAELAPGEYVVRATSGGGASETRIEVPSGRTVRLQVSGRGPSIAEDPWFWVVLTSGVLALAGAAVGIAFAIDPQLTQPVSDPVFGVTATLTLP